MACAENTCQIRKGVLVAIPEKIHKLPSAALRDIKCLADGDEYCEVELTWVQKPHHGRGFLLLGISTSAVLFICLASFLEDMAVISAISILPILVGFYLSKIERLFKENENKDKLIVEQQGYIEERFKELEESNIQLQTTNIELSNSIDKEVRIRKLFERYVPEKVVSEVLQRSDEYLFTGENRHASILFLDVRHFTAFAEKHKPEDVVDVLNKLFSEVSKTIINRGGIVDKFVGDGVLAVFGAPASLDDHALCAVSAAIEIKESLEGFNCWLKDRMDESIVVGISINSGEIISGNVGSIEKMEYTVVGGPVNKAFRIQDFIKEKPNCILIGKDTYSEVKDKVKAVSWGIKNLRGSSEGIELFEVLGYEHNV
jgi:class 3 adenylate cyclase